MSGISRKSNSILRKLVGGLWKIVKDCCCGCDACTSSNICGNCDSTPTTFTLSLTGTHVCTCFALGGGTGSWKVTGGSIDGTYTLSQDTGGPNYCIWQASISTARTWTEYTSTDCTTGATNYTVTLNIYLRHNVANDTWELEIQFVTSGSRAVTIYYDTWTATANDCCTAMATANDQTDSSCDEGMGGTIVYGGSGTVSPC